MKIIFCGIWPNYSKKLGKQFFFQISTELCKECEKIQKMRIVRKMRKLIKKMR